MPGTGQTKIYWSKNSNQRSCAFLGPANQGEVVDTVAVNWGDEVNLGVEKRVFVGGGGIVPEVVEADEAKIFRKIILQ